MIETVLSPRVRGAESFGEPSPHRAGGEELFPAEERMVEAAGAKRRGEFTDARRCARRALALLGMPATALPAAPSGAPDWPPGITGSITHCAGYRAAAVARTADVQSLGVDAEPHAPLPRRVREGISLPAERAQWERLSAERPEVCWDRLLFSVKEALYKACAPWAPRPPRFEDVEVSFAPGGHTFTARPLLRLRPPGCGVPGADTGPRGPLTGRWAAGDGVLVTAVTVPRPPG